VFLLTRYVLSERHSRDPYAEAEGQPEREEKVDKGMVSLSDQKAHITPGREFMGGPLLARSFEPSRGSWMNVVKR
jgi:hypothetical protein